MNKKGRSEANETRTVEFKKSVTVGDLIKCLKKFPIETMVAIDVGDEYPNQFKTVKAVSDNRDWFADNDICWLDAGGNLP